MRSEGDCRNRERWDAYVAAVHDMVGRTSTPNAPWHLVSASDERHAWVRVLAIVCDAPKKAIKRAD